MGQSRSIHEVKCDACIWFVIFIYKLRIENLWELCFSKAKTVHQKQIGITQENRGMFDRTSHCYLESIGHQLDTGCCDCTLCQFPLSWCLAMEVMRVLLFYFTPGLLAQASPTVPPDPFDFWPLVTPLLGDISQPCFDASMEYANGILNSSTWAIQMFDSSGHLPFLQEGLLSDSRAEGGKQSQDRWILPHLQWGRIWAQNERTD